MTLIILAHPSSNDSIANQTIIESLQQTDLDIEIRDIGKLYPDHNIDILSEQAALMKHDVIMFQHPMYWFNVPPILKSWIDQVFNYQFAYGSEGDKLKGKKLLHSVTIGQKEDNVKAVTQSLSAVFEKTSDYCQMDYVGTFPLYDIATLTGNTPEEIKEKAINHSHDLYKAILSIQ